MSDTQTQTAKGINGIKQKTSVAQPSPSAGQELLACSRPSLPNTMETALNSAATAHAKRRASPPAVRPCQQFLAQRAGAQQARHTCGRQAAAGTGGGGHDAACAPHLLPVHAPDVRSPRGAAIAPRAGCMLRNICTVGQILMFFVLQDISIRALTVCVQNRSKVRMMAIRPLRTEIEFKLKHKVLMLSSHALSPITVILSREKRSR